MAILSAILTVLLVLDCAFLIFLVLLQLPKKEAGMGVAFGGGATEALFGAGSGTVLTKVTKYCAGIFMGLSLLLSIMNVHRVQSGRQSLDQQLQQRAASTPVPVAAPSAQPGPLLPMPASGTTNLPALLSSSNLAGANPATPAPTTPPVAASTNPAPTAPPASGTPK
jgi:preprotein translocase subunit SecG